MRGTVRIGIAVVVLVVSGGIVPSSARGESTRVHHDCVLHGVRREYTAHIGGFDFEVAGPCAAMNIVPAAQTTATGHFFCDARAGCSDSHGGAAVELVSVTPVTGAVREGHQQWRRAAPDLVPNQTTYNVYPCDGSPWQGCMQQPRFVAVVTWGPLPTGGGCDDFGIWCWDTYDTTIVLSANWP